MMRSDLGTSSLALATTCFFQERIIGGAPFSVKKNQPQYSWCAAVGIEIFVGFLLGVHPRKGSRRGVLRFFAFILVHGCGEKVPDCNKWSVKIF